MTDMGLYALALVGALVAVLSLLLLLARRSARKAREELRRVTTELEPLRRYGAIVDAEGEAKRIRDEADEYDKQKRTSADAYTFTTRDRADADVAELTRDAREANRASKEKAQAALDGAIAESKRIVESANQQAEEIAGDAIKAKGKADVFEKMARAMKNAVEGYGDEYLIPNHSLLDDLAEEFDHKEAGQKLKQARAHTKSLVRNKIAATCDYVEEYRRETAIRFVIDAFNGKCDTVLSKAKHDNFGKLAQEIRDGFALVNGDGRAFRNARILQDFLEARLNELKWAVAAHELRVQEKEEQRRIREEMREEERARREYEKAIKEAEKEERLLQKAMDAARKQLEQASADETDLLKKKLEELQAKWDEAEERNQRAISMAQQTRQGHVYVISNIGSFGEEVYKIGLTRRLEPLDRIKELGDASVPFEFDVHAMIHSEDAPALEIALHKEFGSQRVNKVNQRKEFFNVRLTEIRGVVDRLGIQAHWTMKAEAVQYRESIAIAEQEAASAQARAN